jgi:hypothetical protein
MSLKEKMKEPETKPETKTKKICEGCFPIFQPNQLAHTCLFEQEEEEEKQEEDVCAICLSELSQKEQKTTKCGHIFHNDCLNKSLKYSSCCPTCRCELKSREEFPLYNLLINYNFHLTHENARRSLENNVLLVNNNFYLTRENVLQSFENRFDTYQDESSTSTSETSIPDLIPNEREEDEERENGMYILD